MAMSVLQPESSVWYTCCWLVVGSRLFSKKMRLGAWKNLQIDDYLVLLAMGTLTVLMSLLHIIIHTKTNLLAPNEDASSFTWEDVNERVYGSKLTMVVEQMHISTIWLLKACMLIMYGRMTELLTLHVVVKAVALYVGIGYAAMQILWFGVWCRPFSQYWAVPPNSTQCSAMISHLITNAVLNISSDVMIMAIPIPLLIKVNLPLGKKLVLGCIFFIGTVTIFAAAYNKHMSFKDPFSNTWIIWYLREVFTAMLCANLPLTRPVLQRLCNIGDWTTARSSLSDGYNGSRLGSLRTRNSYITQPQSAATERSKPNASTPYSSSEDPVTIGPLEILCKTDIAVERQLVNPLCFNNSLAMEGMDSKRSGKDTDAVSTKSKPKSILTACCHEDIVEPRGF
ncbi:hypothetical protein BS50DRAFT_48781 [Corynespora cassiicola Philippines]|uniref:Rhodopsin domain-containing protein n=1 Tax=Corynespora cassiicola Philippines TaxID=1448308 RepID=A0A2T2NI03_CORCC|nr:hypothetical protein BS50DRAFT_48781 [Corynespora cassiicola Philippines]